MNNPARPVEDELARIAAAGFDFVDLTVEPPQAWPVEGERVARLLAQHGLGIVGHTAYYLPIASAFPELREQAHRLLIRAFEAFAAAGAAAVNVHPDALNRLFAVEDVRARNAEALASLAEEAQRRGLRLMVENLGRSFSHPADIEPLLAASPDLAFHLDVGHANLARARDEPNRTADLVAAAGDRLAHVHVHDNNGVDDLHLPLGAGTIAWPEIVRTLKQAGYDGTVTLEVFAHPYLTRSRELWLEWWRADES